MCNLTDSFMEEQYQDPEFLAWLEQKNKQLKEQMEHHHNSTEYDRDAIAAEMNNQLMGYTDCDDSISSYIISKELMTELFNNAIADEMNNQLSEINDQLMEEMKDPEFSSWLENTIDELANELLNEL